MKRKAWYIWFPGGVYALGPVRFEHPVRERDVRDYARAWSKLTRLPAGFSCWPAS